MKQIMTGCAVCVSIVLVGCTGAPDSQARHEVASGSTNKPVAAEATRDSSTEMEPLGKDSPPKTERPHVAAANSAPSSEPQGSSFVSKPGPTHMPEAPAAMNAAEQARYDAVAQELVRTLNSEDKTAYRALHTDEGWNSSIDWWQNMFAMQRANFGPIVRAYPCTRETLRFGKFGFRGEGTTFVAIFEEKVGAALSFELNEDNKIIRTSVFIKQEMAEYHPSGVTPIFERN